MESKDEEIALVEPTEDTGAKNSSSSNMLLYPLMKLKMKVVEIVQKMELILIQLENTCNVALVHRNLKNNGHLVINIVLNAVFLQAIAVFNIC